MKKILPLLFLLTAFAACKKENSSNTTQMPAPTHDGRNVVAWKMDGKVYVAQGGSLFGGRWAYGGIRLNSDTVTKGHILFISGTNRETSSALSNTATLKIYCLYYRKTNQPLALGEHPFYGLAGYVNYSTDPPTVTRGETDSLRTGTVIVTHEDSTTISGTFQMDVANDQGKVFHVTEGIFDVTK